LRFLRFELDRQRAELRGPDGAVIRIRPRSLEMLTLFAANAGRVLSKQELMEAVWPDVHVGEDSLFQSIRELRTALGDDERQIIKLMSGRGYLFVAEVSDTTDTDATEQPGPPVAPEARSEPAPGRSGFSLRRRPVLMALAGLGVLALAAAAWLPRLMTGSPVTLAVVPMATASDDPLAARMAAGVASGLTDGLANIGTIRVVASPPDAGSQSPRPAPVNTPPADLVLSGELQKNDRSWVLHARLISSATREVEWTTTVSVATDGVDTELQQSRLVAGLGHRLAVRINARLYAPTPGNARAAIDQAKAAINQTTRERFADAQAMLEKALADNPDDVDLQVALAAHLMRGVQMVWYNEAGSAAAESNARALLERALRTRPNYIPTLEAYCRFLNATDQFVESLVACATALNSDPWNGLVLYHIGLGQVQLGRFEDALATFKRADRFDTPEVSRWTWLLGAGWANLLMGRNEDAIPWLQRSIAITPATGRTDFMLAVAYHRLGRTNEAHAAFAKAMALRPGATALNVGPPTRNASPAFIDAGKRVMQEIVAMGLPER